MAKLNICHMCLHPFGWTNVFSAKNMCFAFWARVDTKLLNLSHHFKSMDGWPGDATFFPCGANLWRSSACIKPKKVQPLGIYFWHLRLGLFKSPFWLVKLNICSCSLLLGQMYFQPKIMCFALWARVDTKLLNLSHHVLSMDGWPGDATFFPVGPTFEDHQHVFSQKRSSPLEFIFDACASASSGHLFWLVKLNICGCSLLLGQMYFQQKTCVLHFGRALTQNAWICHIISYLWMVGLVVQLFSCGANLWRSSACIQPKKVQPLGIYFWHLRLGLFRSPFWLVKLNIICGCRLFQGQMYVQQKKQCFAFWAHVDTKLLNLSHHFLSMDGWPGDATFFPVGPTFEDHQHV